MYAAADSSNIHGAGTKGKLMLCMYLYTPPFLAAGHSILMF